MVLYLVITAELLVGFIDHEDDDHRGDGENPHHALALAENSAACFPFGHSETSLTGNRDGQKEGGDEHSTKHKGRVGKAR